jgi:UDP-GlcNAc:undecaprenyl-phosphate/decaprenyl-phosphate GlcNAc-1-phosphate transferase
MEGLPLGIQATGSLALATILTALITPLAIRLAVRTSFFDQPIGYKRHAGPTPYLGGIAVILGFLGAALAFDADLDAFAAIALTTLALLVIGTLDDRVGLGVLARVSVQVAAALVLYGANVRWDVTDTAAVNLLVTIVWVVGLTNAFNLMDNLDGAAGTVAAVSAAGTGIVGAADGDTGLAVVSFALCGACLGFLRFNLAKPARIFLGDGGSMPIGLVVAAIVMQSPDGSLGWASLPALAPLAGLPIFDTTLVIVSRYRRGAPILSGGRDHLTHRLLGRLGTARSVAMVMGGAQALLCALAVVLDSLTPQEVAAAAVAYLTCSVVALAILDSPGWLRHVSGEQPA